MAKLLDFTEQYFSRFSPDDQKWIKRMVFRKDFQTVIVEARKKHGYPPFVQIDAAKMRDDLMAGPLIEDDPYAIFPLLYYQTDEALKKTISESIRKLPEPRGGLEQIAYCIARYDVFPSLWKGAGGEDSLSDTELKGLVEAYSQYDTLVVHGEPERAEELLNHNEMFLFNSGKVRVRTHHSEIIITLSPGARKTDVGKAMEAGAIWQYLEYFREKKARYGQDKAHLLDLMNDALEYSEQGKTITWIVDTLANEIKADLWKKGVRDEDAIERRVEEILGKNVHDAFDGGSGREALVRKWIERAKELGF